MRIAVRHLMLGSCLMALGALAPIASHAQAIASAQAATPPAPAAAPSSPPEVKIPDLSSALPDPKKDPKGELTAGKIPESVKDVIKRLNVKTEDVTLDDLNAAREAVAKLDALIDIEKRLVDLDKIKQEREESTKAALVAAIPATALTPPPMPMAPAAMPERPMIMPQANVDVERIEGSNNHYSAVLKEGDNERVVHPGDHLPDDSVVLSITTRGVELQRNNKTRLLQVKDVQSVFGNTP